jgi:hypothetical protein
VRCFVDSAHRDAFVDWSRENVVPIPVSALINVDEDSLEARNALSEAQDTVMVYRSRNILKHWFCLIVCGLVFFAHLSSTPSGRLCGVYALTGACERQTCSSSLPGCEKVVAGTSCTPTQWCPAGYALSVHSLETAVGECICPADNEDVDGLRCAYSFEAMTGESFATDEVFRRPEDVQSMILSLCQPIVPCRAVVDENHTVVDDPAGGCATDLLDSSGAAHQIAAGSTCQVECGGDFVQGDAPNDVLECPEKNLILNAPSVAQLVCPRRISGTYEWRYTPTVPPSDREYTSITATCQLDSSFHAIQKHNSTDGDSIFEISVTVAANDTCVLAFECPFSFTAVSVDLSCDADNTVADLEEPELPMSCQKMPFVPCGHVDIEQIDQSNYPDVNLSSIDFGSCSDVGNGSSCVLECGAGYTRQPSCNCSSGSATGQNLTCLPDCTIQTLPPFATCPEQNLDRDLPPTVNRLGDSSAIPLCIPTQNCIGPTDIDSEKYAGDCATVPAGASCSLPCSSKFVDATNGNGGEASPGRFDCPGNNTSPARSADVVTSPPICVPAEACAQLDAPSSEYDVGQCANVDSGDACAISLDCNPGRFAPDATATFSCPDSNIDDMLQPIGTWPQCFDIVPCEGPQALGASLDASTCSSVESNQTCSVGCARGYAKGSATVACPGNNVDSSTSAVVANRVDCELIVPCAPMVPVQGAALASLAGVNAVDNSLCAPSGGGISRGIGAGQSCKVIITCAEGYTQMNSTDVSVGVFSCPFDNTNAATQVAGTMPQCRPCLPGQYYEDGDCSTCPEVYTAGCDAAFGPKLCPFTMAAQLASVGFEDTCNECDEFPSRCRGGNGMCVEASFGPACEMCANGYYSLGQACERCPDNDLFGNIMALLFLMAFIFVLWKVGGVDVATGTVPNRAIVTGIVLPHIQLVSIELSLAFEWPVFLKVWAKSIKALLSFDLSMLTAGPECALSGDTMIESWANKWFITQAGIWILLAFFCVLRVTLSIANRVGFVERRTKNHCMNCIVALYSLLYTTWIQACLKPFACSYRMGVPEGQVSPDVTSGSQNFTQEIREYLSFDAVPVAECFQGAHKNVAVFSLVVIVFVVLIIPITIFNLLEKQHNKNMLSTLESKTQFGWIYLRYKAELWWYESAILFQRTAIIACTLFVENPASQALSISFVLIWALQMHVRHVPFYSHGHRHSENMKGIKRKWFHQATRGDKLQLLCLGSELAVSLLGLLCIFTRYRWYLIPAEEQTLQMKAFDIIISLASLVMVLFPPLTTLRAHGQEQEEQDAAFKAMTDKLLETLSHDVMCHDVYESLTARHNAFASDSPVQRFRVVRAGGCHVLQSFVADHSKASHRKAQASAADGERLVIECGSVIESCDTKYDDAGVMHVCIEHILVVSSSKGEEVDLAGPDFVHERLMLADIQLNGIQYKWREHTQDVFQKTEEGALIQVGKVKEKLWVPTQLRYASSYGLETGAAGRQQHRMQLQEMDDTDPGDPHLYKIVVEHCDMYDGRNSSNFLHDCNMTIGNVIRGSAPIMLTEGRGVPRVHSTFSFSGWIRGLGGDEDTYAQIVIDTVPKLDVNPAADDFENVSKKLKANDRVIVLEKRVVHRGRDVVRARIAELGDSQDGKEDEKWITYLDDGAAGACPLGPIIVDGKDGVKGVQFVKEVAGTNLFAGGTAGTFDHFSHLPDQVIEIIKSQPPMLTRTKHPSETPIKLTKGTRLLAGMKFPYLERAVPKVYDKKGKAHPTMRHIWYRIEFKLEAWIPIIKGSDRQLEPLKPADLRRSAPPDSIFTTAQPTLTGDEAEEHVFGARRGRFVAYTAKIGASAAHAKRVVGIDAAADLARGGADAVAKWLPAGGRAEKGTGDPAAPAVTRFVNPLDVE